MDNHSCFHVLKLPIQCTCPKRIKVTVLRGFEGLLDLRRGSASSSAAQNAVVPVEILLGQHHNIAKTWTVDCTVEAHVKLVCHLLFGFLIHSLLIGLIGVDVTASCLWLLGRRRRLSGSLASFRRLSFVGCGLIAGCCCCVILHCILVLLILRG